MKRRRLPSETKDDIPVRRYVARSFYCEGCGRLISSYENDEGVQKVSCDYCGLTYVRKMKGRRHICSDMYAPEWATFDLNDAI